MIVEWFVGVLATIGTWIAGIFPTADPPTWLTDSDSMLNDALGEFGALSNWVPLSLGATVAAAILSCLVIGFTIKVVRIVASFLLAGGGSAG